jgi:hypothetical protein
MKDWSTLAYGAHRAPGAPGASSESSIEFLKATLNPERKHGKLEVYTGSFRSSMEQLKLEKHCGAIGTPKAQWKKNLRTQKHFGALGAPKSTIEQMENQKEPGSNWDIRSIMQKNWSK